MAVTKEILVRYSTDSSGSTSFSVDTEKNVAIRYFVRNSSGRSPGGGSTDTAKVNIYGTITHFETDRGSVITTGDSIAGTAATDAVFLFTEDTHTSSLQHFHRITISWSDLTSDADISIMYSKF
jgi:hypothetical protein